MLDFPQIATIPGIPFFFHFFFLFFFDFFWTAPKILLFFSNTKKSKIIESVALKIKGPEAMEGIPGVYVCQIPTLD